MKLGLIGLGNLGTPIAENLLQKGNKLHLYNRTAAKTQPFTNSGAVIYPSVKELASLCDIVFSIVSDDAALKHITEGEEGIAANLKAGGIHVSISTILPATSTQLSQTHAQHNNHYLAAPVMGRPEAARAHKLNFLVSGDASVIQVVKPFLQDAGAAGVWELGDDVQNANAAKLCSNFLIIAAIQSMAEAINLAKKSGIDPQQWFNMLTQTLFAAPIYINYGNILLKEAYEPAAFSLRLGLKDVNLVQEQAKQSGAQMMFGDALKQRLQECIEKGWGEHDWTAIALALK